MDFQDKRYVVGVDLGTTNSAVSYINIASLQESGYDPKHKKRAIKIFKVPQLTGSGEFLPFYVLPSFLYIPGEYDISKESITHPWKRENDMFAGLFAREHGSLVPSRLVSSAKSWLCHARADRQAKILPWGSDKVEKISPVTATAEYLRHIRKAWNHSVKDEDDFLENQYVVITVPASFDESAREFTLEAARQAGFQNQITILEEPLAAFYSWLVDHEHNWQKYVKPDDLILVCDVGGGTTDFTLISLKNVEGSPRFERIAVGDHLILGGDNIDLALAKFVESKFSKKQTLTSDKWKTLCHKCRSAKEQILANDDINSVRLTIKGEGGSLIAGTLSAELTRADLERILCEGFFPDVEQSKESAKKVGRAIAEFGLPYEQEPAITRHIGWFLEKHRANIKASLGKEPIPDLILFNGGSLKSKLIQEQIRISIRKWFNSNNDAVPKILENSSPDLAVAIGASYYGLVKQGIGVKVGSGSPRSYYIEISKQYSNLSAIIDSSQLSDNNDNISADKDNSAAQMVAKAICIVERGLDEGTTIKLPDMQFEVIANQPVLFNILSSSFRSGDKSGDIVDIDDTLTQMTPLQTIIRFGKKSEKSYVPVVIEPQYTEVGTLALCCRSCISNHRWKLQFQLRETSLIEAKDTEIFDNSLIENACQLIEKNFSIGIDKSKNSDVQGLDVQTIVKQIEALVDKKKSGWSLSFLRALADCLIKNADLRKNSPAHEVRWLNLTGFCIRPGFGDAFDQERIRQLWKIYLTGLIFHKYKQNCLEWWIFCRRLAGGLSAGQQRQFFQNATPYLISDSNNKKICSPQEIIEIWMAVANMERLIVKDKISLAKKLISSLKPGKTAKQMFWALSRIGARELLYGSIDRVVPAKEAASWIKQLCKIEWSQNDPIVHTIIHIMRKTGDRTRDFSDDSIDIIMPWFKQMEIDESSLSTIKKVVPIESFEVSTIYGETLPHGLILKEK